MGQKGTEWTARKRLCHLLHYGRRGETARCRSGVDSASALRYVGGKEEAPAYDIVPGHPFQHRVRQAALSASERYTRGQGQIRSAIAAVPDVEENQDRSE